MNYQKSARVMEVTDELYAEMGAAGFDVLLDDRDARPGVKFADSELIGIPHRLVIGERSLSNGMLEYRHRRATASEEIPLADAVEFIRRQQSA
jgi:prolyl-tRNA synthetase